MECGLEGSNNNRGFYVLKVDGVEVGGRYSRELVNVKRFVVRN